MTVTDYLKFERGGNIVKTDAFYCTKMGQVKGVLTLTEHYMQFDPTESCPENELLVLYCF